MTLPIISSPDPAHDYAVSGPQDEISDDEHMADGRSSDQENVVSEWLEVDSPTRSSSKSKAEPTGHTTADPLSVEEGGRTYHGYDDGSYYFPNDGLEQDRLDLQHALLLLSLNGKLFLAPLEKPVYVLDIATGTGIWAIEFADQHPDAQIIGTDLSIIQPSNAPPNCYFVRENSEKAEWLFPQPFDYIHLRMVFHAFDDPRAVMQKSYDALRPGGWVEYMDGSCGFTSFDGTTRGTHIETWTRQMYDAVAARGRDANVARRYTGWMQEMGFLDIGEVKIPVPSNPWPKAPVAKQVGRYSLANNLQGIEGMSYRLFKSAGYSDEYIEELLEKVKKELADPSIHAVWLVRVVYARKPVEWELENSGIGIEI